MLLVLSLAHLPVLSLSLRQLPLLLLLPLALLLFLLAARAAREEVESGQRAGMARPRLHANATSRARRLPVMACVDMTRGVVGADAKYTKGGFPHVRSATKE